MKELSKEGAGRLNSFLLLIVDSIEDKKVNFSKLEFDTASAFHMIYEIKMYEDRTGEIFNGEELKDVNEHVLKTFLGKGGFKMLYKEDSRVRKRDDFRFWSVGIITFITLVLTIWQVYFACKQSQSKSQTGTQLETKKQSLDSGLTNSKKDTLHSPPAHTP